MIRSLDVNGKEISLIIDDELITHFSDKGIDVLGEIEQAIVKDSEKNER